MDSSIPLTTNSVISVIVEPLPGLAEGMDVAPAPSSEYGDGMMLLRGTLRQRGTEYVLEQRLSQDAVGGTVWTTPRLYQLLASPATQDAVSRLVNCDVSVTGHPEYSDARRRISVVLDSIDALTSLPDAN